MVILNERIQQPVCAGNLDSLNRHIQKPVESSSIVTLNKAPRDIRPAPSQARSHPQTRHTPAQNVTAPSVPPPRQIQKMSIPRLERPLQKGQKIKLESSGGAPQKLRFCFGWNVKNSMCDMDASAFLCTAGNRVPDDDWFVFYGQPDSPDGSVHFSQDSSHKDREIIRVDLSRLDRRIQRIVFVLTLNEAFENHLNFNMMEDTYVRIIDESTNQILASFQLNEYYETVTSMTIGELYLHNGDWKFNPVGNGVHQDLPGQCKIYGVNIC